MFDSPLLEEQPGLEKLGPPSVATSSGTPICANKFLSVLIDVIIIPSILYSSIQAESLSATAR